MPRTLNRSVVAGGVIYPAGTPATRELDRQITDATLWSGADEAPRDSMHDPVRDPSDTPTAPRPRKRRSSKSADD